MAIKKVEVAEAPPNLGLTDLSIIGVPVAQQKRLPGLAGYPRKFSAEGLSVWTTMLQDPEYKKEIRNKDDLDLVWHLTILEFLSRCQDQGVLPFANNTDVTKNEYIAEFLTKARIYCVQFVKECRFFDRVKVRKAFREYTRKDNGLVIRTWAELYVIKDPTFENWLMTVPMPRFHRQPDNRYTRLIMPHITMWVRYINAARVIVGFDIEVAGTINIPGKPNPSRKAVDKFIDQTIWLPIIRAHRITDIKNRLF